jgi:hypothetical protein
MLQQKPCEPMCRRERARGALAPRLSALVTGEAGSHLTEFSAPGSPSTGGQALNKAEAHVPPPARPSCGTSGPSTDGTAIVARKRWAPGHQPPAAFRAGAGWWGGRGQRIGGPIEGMHAGARVPFAFSPPRPPGARPAIAAALPRRRAARPTPPANPSDREPQGPRGSGRTAHNPTHAHPTRGGAIPPAPRTRAAAALDESARSPSQDAGRRSPGGDCRAAVGLAGSGGSSVCGCATCGPSFGVPVRQPPRTSATNFQVLCGVPPLRPQSLNPRGAGWVQGAGGC